MMICLSKQRHIARSPSSVVPLVVTPYMPTRVSHPRLWKDGRVEECMNILIVNGFRLFKVTTCYHLHHDLKGKVDFQKKKLYGLKT